MKKTSLFFLWLFMSYGFSYAQYCIPSYSSGPSFGIFIDGVSLEGIQNLNSGGNGTAAYKDYSEDFSALLTMGRSYELSVTVGPDYFGSVGVWIDFNQDEDFDDQGEFFGANRDIRGGETVIIPIDIPINAQGGATRMRIIQVYASPSLTPCGNYNYGETEDYGIDILSPSTDDIGITAIVSPQITCGLGSQETLEVTVANFGSDPQQEMTLGYSLNGGVPVIEEVFLALQPSGGTANYQFSTTLDLSALGTYELKVWTTLANDTIPANDTLITSIENQLLVDTFPYLENFEEGANGWEADGINVSWELGTPSMNIINEAASGINAWSTGGVSGTGYQPGEISFLTSPCLDFSDLELPVFEANIWWESEYTRDGAQLQASIDGGETWQVIGNINEGENWYNSDNLSSFPIGERQGWGGNNNLGSGGWLPAKYLLTDLAGEPEVKLRFKFAANTFTQYDGFAVDDINIYDFPKNEVGVTALINPRFPFRPGSKDIAVEITNFGLDTLTTVNIHWSVNGVEQDVYRWTGTLARNATSVRGIAEYTIEPLTEYEIVIWTSLPNGVADENPLNDSLNLGTIMAAMSGDIIVGGNNGNFENLSEATKWLQIAGVYGQTNFLINPGSYEEHIYLNSIPYVSNAFPVYFQAANEDSASVIISYTAQNEDDNFVLCLDSTEQLFFQNLTLQARGTNFGRVIELKNGAKQNRFSNIRMIGVEPTDSSLQQAIVYTKSIWGNPNNDNDFLRNTFVGGSYGIMHEGFFASVNSTEEWEIIENKFENQYKGGLFVSFINKLKVSDNKCISDQIGSYYIGLELQTCREGFLLNRNQIFIPYGGNGMKFSGGGTTNVYNHIINNYISIGGEDISAGIVCGNTGWENFYHNTIHIYNTHSESAAIRGRFVQNNILNNIFANTGSGLAMRINSYNRNYTVFDYNNSYTSGNIFAKNGSQILNRLSDWQTSTSQDANTISVYPFFLSDTSFQAREILLNGAAKPLQIIESDILENPRDEQVPDIGAFEFQPSSNPDGGLVDINEPPTPFAPNSRHTIKVKLRNYSTTELVSAKISWKINGMLQEAVNWSGMLESGEETSIELGRLQFGQQQFYTIQAEIEEVNGIEDTLVYNNIIETEAFRPLFAGDYTIGGSDGDFASFTEAIEALQFGGIGDTIRFWVRPGTYEEQINVTGFTYYVQPYPIIFASESGDSSSVILTYASNNPEQNYTLNFEKIRFVHFSRITIEAKGEQYGSVVHVGEECENITLSNNIIKGIIPTDIDAQHEKVLIYNEKGLTGIHFKNNYFLNGSIGFFSQYPSGIRRMYSFIDNDFQHQTEGGIHLAIPSECDVQGNKFHTEISSPFYYKGILLEHGEGSGENRITSNIIYVAGNGTGIQIGQTASGGSDDVDATLINNHISILGTEDVKGIYISYPSDIIKLYHNSVRIQSDGSASSSPLFVVNNTINVEYGSQIANNIFANFGKGYAAYYSTNYYQNMLIDHNAYYSADQQLIYNNSQVWNLEEWQENTNHGWQSINVNPQFIDTNNLHANAFELRDVGLLDLNIDVDIEGNERGTPPDIGAYEQTSILEIDAHLLAILSPSSNMRAGTSDIKIVIQNQGNSPLASIPISWRINTENRTTIWNGNLDVGEKDTLDLGTYTFVSDTTYELSFISELTQDTNPLNDSLNAEFSFGLPPLSGVYQIGGIDADFETFTDAVLALIGRGIESSVKFEITDGQYEEQLIIPYIRGTSETDTILFTSISGDSSTVDLSFSPDNDGDNFVIWLAGAQYVHFSHLSLKNNGNAYGRVLQITSGAAYNSFDHTQFRGLNTTQQGDQHTLVLLNEEGTSTNHHHRFSNSTFLYGSTGISASSNPRAHHWQIQNNKFLYNFKEGIKMQNQNDIYIANNYFEEDTLIRPSFNDYSGILLDKCDGEIEILKNTIVATNGGYGIQSRSYQGSQEVLIANNFLSMGRRNIPNSANAIVRGLHIYYGQNHRIYHNSVNILRRDFSGDNHCIQLEETDNVIVKNNIFANQGGGQAIYTVRMWNQNFISDYNNLYTTGAYLATWGSFRRDLAAWQFSSNQDANSVSASPEFFGERDLHTNSQTLNGVGTHLPNIGTDIDGDLRSGKPDLGADEYIIDSLDVAVQAVISPQSGFLNGPQAIKIAILNNGFQSFDSLSITYEVNGIPQNSFNWVGNLESGESDTVQIGEYTFSGIQPHSIFVWIDQLQGDSDIHNDSLLVDGLIAKMRGIYTIGHDSTVADFSSFGAAIEALEIFGIGDSVIMQVMPGEYQEYVELGPIPQNSDDSYLVFEAQNGDSSSVTLIDNPSVNNFFTIYADGAKNVIFRNLTIVNTNGNSVITISRSEGFMKFLNNEIRSEGYYSEVLFRSYTSPNNLQIKNNYFHHGRIGMSLLGTDDTFVKGAVVSGNVLEDITASAILLTKFDAPIIKGNIVHAVNPDLNFKGITLQICKGAFEVSHNTIQTKRYDYGINISRTNANNEIRGKVYNNVFAIQAEDQRGGGQLGNQAAVYIFESAYVDIVHNSLRAGFKVASRPTHAIKISKSREINIMNNILASYGDGYTIFSDHIQSIANSNNNYLFSSGENLIYVENPISDLENWQNLSGYDMDSWSFPIEYMDSLVIPNSSLLDGSAQVVDYINDDIEGNPRPQNSDIGAYEFSSIAIDAGLSNWVTPDDFLPNGQNPIQVTLTNFGKIALSSTEIHWQLNGILQTPFTWSGNLESGNSEVVEIGQANFEFDENYQLTAWTEQPNGIIDSISYNDTIQTLPMNTALGGYYTVGGSSPDFPTLNDVVQGLNTRGILDSVIFLLRDGIYEEQIALAQIRGSSPQNFVRFESESQDSSAVLILGHASSSDAAILLDSTKNIQFRHIGLGANREGNFVNTILIKGNADSIQIENCYLEAKPAIGMIINRFNPNLNRLSTRAIIENNQFQNGRAAISWTGTYQVDYPVERELVIKNNIFEDQLWENIVIRDAGNILIEGNRLSNRDTVGFTGYFNSINVSGIRNQFDIINNIISVQKKLYRRTDVQGIGVSNNTGLTTTQGTIANNMVIIDGVLQESPFSRALIGIKVNSYNTKIVYNSVQVSTNEEDIKSFPLSLRAQKGVYVYNNNLISRGNSEAFYYENGLAARSEYQNFSDHNNLYSQGEKPIRTYITSNSAQGSYSLEDWQNQTGMDQNSISIYPQFDGEFDLHSRDTRLDSMGIAIPWVQMDIDGDPRNPDFPDIGADEFDAPIRDLAIDFVLLDAINCGLDMEEVIQVQISNPGNRTINEPVLAYIVDGGNPVYDAPDGVRLAPNETQIFTFSQTANLSALGEHEITIYIEYLGFTQTNYDNDTLHFTFINAAEISETFSSLQPADGSNDLSLPINFSWNPINGATTYDLSIWPENDSTNLIQILDIDTAAYTYRDMLEGSTRYKWQVAAEGECNEIEGPIYSFITSRDPIILDPEDVNEVGPIGGIRTERQAPNPPKIYPNPGDGIIYLDFSQEVSLLKVEVFNVQGQLIHQHKFANDSKRFEVNLRDFAAGFYYLYITMPDQMIKEKIQIIR